MVWVTQHAVDLRIVSSDPKSDEQLRQTVTTSAGHNVVQLLCLQVAIDYLENLIC